jgi:hypothetical protein
MSEISDCFFCNEKAKYTGVGPLDQVFEVDCPNCGLFKISGEVFSLFPFKEIENKKYLLSGLIKEKNELGLNQVVIEYDDIKKLFNDSLIPSSFMQKIDKVLLYIYKKSSFFGSTIVINENTPYSIGYARNWD